MRVFGGLATTVLLECLWLNVLVAKDIPIPRLCSRRETSIHFEASLVAGRLARSRLRHAGSFDIHLSGPLLPDSPPELRVFSSARHTAHLAFTPVVHLVYALHV